MIGAAVLVVFKFNKRNKNAENMGRKKSNDQSEDDKESPVRVSEVWQVLSTDGVLTAVQVVIVLIVIQHPCHTKTPLHANTKSLLV
jgi:hypothetical protein